MRFVLACATALALLAGAWAGARPADGESDAAIRADSLAGDTIAITAPERALAVAAGAAGPAGAIAGAIAGATPAPGMPDGPQTALAARYRYDLRAFAYDIQQAGRISTPRAKYLATVAVAEAYRQRVPPALVLGVLLTENDVLKSSARSRVGAVGLMQIMPNVWLETLGPIFGYDLRNDATNLRMGIHILRDNLRAAGGDVRTALLRYNGCVRSVNTPNCWRYPDVVRRKVERYGRYICPRSDYGACIAAPLVQVYARRP